MEEGTPPGKDDNASNDRNGGERGPRTTATTSGTATNSDLNHDTSPTPVKPPPIPEDLTTPEVPSTLNARKLKVAYDDMKARYAKMKKNCEEQKAEYEKTVAEKDRVINELMGSDESTVPKLMKMYNEDVFVAKPKKGAKTVQSKGCSISGCENVSVELIKCNLCGNHVCEECCGVKFLKLRPVLNLCNTL